MENFDNIKMHGMCVEKRKKNVLDYFVLKKEAYGITTLGVDTLSHNFLLTYNNMLLPIHKQ
jgi:hypothetical protein